MDGVILRGRLRLRVGVAGVARGFGEGRDGLCCLGFRYRKACCQRQGAEQGQGRQEIRSVSLHDVPCFEVKEKIAQVRVTSDWKISLYTMYMTGNPHLRALDNQQ